MNRLLIILLGFGLLALSSACGNAPQSNETTNDAMVALPDDFLYFLDEFHSDPEFQMAHIQWPLQGLPSMMDSSYVEGSFKYTADDWTMHHGFDETNDEFEQVYTIFGDDIVKEQILHINGSMGMERRFARRDSSWTLIYYAGMNFIRKGE